VSDPVHGIELGVVDKLLRETAGKIASFAVEPSRSPNVEVVTQCG